MIKPAKEADIHKTIERPPTHRDGGTAPRKTLDGNSFFNSLYCEKRDLSSTQVTRPPGVNHQIRSFCKELPPAQTSTMAHLSTQASASSTAMKRHCEFSYASLCSMICHMSAAFILLRSHHLKLPLQAHNSSQCKRKLTTYHSKVRKCTYPSPDITFFF